jgi:predicted MFS family arabinose efflux permease
MKLAMQEIKLFYAVSIRTGLVALVLFISLLATGQLARPPRTLTLGFALQVLGFGAVALIVAGLVPLSLRAGQICAGVGFGTVMPIVIGAVIGGVDPRHAGLASGIAISTFQIGLALGVAIIGGAFYSVLGAQADPTAYDHAFAIARGCNEASLALGGVLSLGLPDKARRATISWSDSKA